MPLIYEIADDFKSVKVYHYVPSEVAGYIFVAAFSVGALAHIFFMFQLRARHFIPFIIGAASRSRTSTKLASFQVFI